MKRESANEVFTFTSFLFLCVCVLYRFPGHTEVVTCNHGPPRLDFVMSDFYSLKILISMVGICSGIILFMAPTLVVQLQQRFL